MINITQKKESTALLSLELNEFSRPNSSELAKYFLAQTKR
jgi:hypothetical protein